MTRTPDRLKIVLDAGACHAEILSAFCLIPHG
jgi:hypothetical protein